MPSIFGGASRTVRRAKKGAEKFERGAREEEIYLRRMPRNVFNLEPSFWGSSVVPSAVAGADDAMIPGQGPLKYFKLRKHISPRRVESVHFVPQSPAPRKNGCG
jgi:hypothetical protein